jgi:hypothetical protein
VRGLVLGLAAAIVVGAACGRSAIDPGSETTTGAAGTTGVAGTTGAAGAVSFDAVVRGAGCGQDLPDGTQATRTGAVQGYTQFTVMATGANLTSTPVAAKAGPRTFWVRVPANYDPQRPYRVVFLGQGCGDPRMAAWQTPALYREAAGGSEQAIYVAIDLPPTEVNMDCYDTDAGLQSEEWEAFELFMSFVDAHYCTDLNKIYVAGYSTGASLANMWGCYFAGTPNPPRKFAPRYHIRAQVALWGQEPTEQPTCGGPVAALWMHGTVSAVSPVTEGAPSLARVGRTNGCVTTYDDESAQAPWHDDSQTIAMGVCRKFTGCPTDYPVVYCSPTIPVQVGPFETFSIPAITTFLDELEAGR